MQQLMDSNFIDQSSVNLPLNESSFMVKPQEEADKSSKNVLSNELFSPNNNIFGENQNQNFNFADDQNYQIEADARLSDPTPKKAPQFDIEKIRF